ncbi:glycoside hydrolase family 3 N-terminal domain-containing protein [Ekhidna sp.]
MKCFFTLTFVSISILSCNDLTSNKSQSGAEQKIDSLLSLMTLEEKIGQTALRGTSSREKGLPEKLKEQVRNGEVGAMLNVMNVEHVKELQRIAMEESPRRVPLIFARDVIHGFKTIFPIPLGQAASWNPDLIEDGARIAAKEATTRGIRWTFAPMVDIARDPRWGRIAESPGEDPYLAEVVSLASVRGYQGDDLANSESMVACVKHFAGYGAAIGGRDYNTAIIHEELLYNTYLPPFKAAVEAGVGTFMTSFNELNGVPATGNQFLLQNVLRDQWGFDGFVVSDWNSVIEMIPHGYAADEREAALKAGKAGMDMEMTSDAYADHLKDLITEGLLDESTLDEMIKNILRIKFNMGLFENADFESENIDYHPDHLEAAKQSAMESMVLLKNSKNFLPINFSKTKVAVIGPLADAPHEQLGTWTFDGEQKHTITPLMTLKKQYGSQVNFVSGLTHSRDKSKKGFSKAIEAAKNSDVILFIGGEEAILSGEAHSRANIDLPGSQEELIKELSKLNKPIVLVIMAGRPITLGNILSDVDAVIMAWHPGTMGGPALVDLLSGKISPSGRLPVTWPKSVGQIPIFYNHKNTGRPASKESFVGIDDIPIGAWQSSLGNNSHYLDDGFTPLFPFGFGLTYSDFEYSELRLNKKTFEIGDAVEVKFNLTNTGSKNATEVVQYYFQDVSASITRPIRELVGFDKIALKSGEEKEITFLLPIEELSFYNKNGEPVLEAGEFNLWVAPNAQEGIKTSFNVR